MGEGWLIDKLHSKHQYFEHRSLYLSYYDSITSDEVINFCSHILTTECQVLFSTRLKYLCI